MISLADIAGKAETMNARFPKAEHVAETMTLPLTVDKATKELYGYSVPVLDTKAAFLALYRAGAVQRITDPAYAVAIEILEERVDALN